MAAIKPLHLDIVGRDWADEVPSPPHDALTPIQRRAHLDQHPLSYLGVTKAPEDADPQTPTTTQELLNAGRRQLEQLLDAGAFDSTDEAGYFLYRLDTETSSQCGIVCGVAVDDYDTGVVRIHEQVRTDRALHLAHHLSVVGAQSSPIALGFEASGALEGALEAERSDAPLVDVTSDDGLRQRVWPVIDAQHISAIESELASQPLYLIDGHHRAAAASTYRSAQLGDAHDDTFDWMLCAIFPLSHLRNKAFHRVLHGIDDAAELRVQLKELFASRSVASPSEASHRGPSEIVVRLPDDDGWLLIDIPLVETADDAATIIANLDTVRLATRLLGPEFDVDEAQPDGRLTYQPGFADASSLAAIVPEADEAIFIMRPVQMSELVAASDAGLVMPPKSTYFEPKVRSGIFLHRNRRSIG